jgi:cysteinyl-tRNA synthetase
MALKVYSTLTREENSFPKQPGETVTMYVCGPTVYKPSHIGHMVGPVIFDTVKRYLTYLGYKVTWVVNITDVDDKLIKRAAELNTTVPALAERMTADYFDCLKKLNVTGIDHFPKATEHIGGMIGMITRLIEKGYAYPAAGDVYFDVSKDPDYGKLCNRDPEQLEAGSRIEVSDRKRNPGDFALWKGAKPGEPKEAIWESPWGPGRPGWHIECSVMASKLLGDTLDIHGGGLDLQFPHHENELAQSESASGKDFARVWMHNGLLKMGTAKMAGSVGNVVNIADLLHRQSPETVRLLLLSTHYRSPIEYSEDRLNEVAKSLEGFYRFFERFERLTGQSFYAVKPFDSDDELPSTPPEPVDERIGIMVRWKRFQERMDKDFNTGGAVGILHESLGTLNRFADRIEKDAADALKPQLEEAVRYLRTMGSILGLFWEAPHKRRLIDVNVEHNLVLADSSAATRVQADPIIEGLMQLLIDLRGNLRTEAKGAAKDNPLKTALFAQTDLIRKRLAELGVTLEDRPAGTTWRVG